MELAEPNPAGELIMNEGTVITDKKIDRYKKYRGT